MTIEAALHDAQAALAKFVNSSEAKLEAQLLLKNLLNVNRAWLISHQNDVLEANINEAYRVLINRRLNGEPIAYILGTREFYGLNLKVTPATLIPRPDTETLVDVALAKIPLQKNLNICDLGTGSGAIALAIAKHRPQAFVLALDASQATLDIAIDNAKNLAIANAKFILSDWFNALKNEKFDIIVSNPPYIEVDDAHLSQGDLRFEPIAALASGQDGLDDIRRIINQAPQHLNPHCWLLLEHGYNQAEKVAALLKQAGFVQISHVQDLSGTDRVTIGCMAPHS
jgi:release factor glutamine methyltransferase